MVDISQDVIVTEDDCGTDGFVVAREFKDGNELIENLFTRIVGRTSFEDIYELYDFDNDLRNIFTEIPYNSIEEVINERR